MNMTVGDGAVDRHLGEADVKRLAERALDSLALDGRRVLVIVPDGTRTMPMPLLFEVLDGTLGGRVAALDYLVALGTHQPMTDEQLCRLVGRRVVDGMAGRSRVMNHRWDDPGTFVTLGIIPAAEMDALTGGLLVRDVPISLNRLVLDYDHVIICGPVFPHEVAGFSGGNKYLFPGIAGGDIIDFTHWLGALLTSASVIGCADTAVRRVIDRAADMLDRPVTCMALVVTHEGINGLYIGPTREAWRQAAALSAQVHISWVERPFERVLSIMPVMYDDLWTAAKGMYKVEPVVADGGEVVIYAPHLHEISRTHGRLIEEIGYHCRDYFLAQWGRFERYPGGVLAHSTHVKGAGTFDAATGTEHPRITVTLATGIPRETCAAVNLGYLSPASIKMDEWIGRESEGRLVVPRAGERLFRLRAVGIADRESGSAFPAPAR
jgi:nickel-dependent lactate racemase